MASFDLPKAGELFAGKYRVMRLLGQGGMGAVYEAQHELLSQRVAIKFLLSEIAGNSEAVARFIHEARAAAQIRSEHAVRIMDAEVSPDGLPFMVLEYLEGADLAQVLLRLGRASAPVAVDYILQVLEAIYKAHSLNIIHRDIKPGNLFLCKQADGVDVVKVLDFGISKIQNPFGEVEKPSLTATKAMLGSPLYMSPEQLRNSKKVTKASDLWSVGVVLYELLSGELPFGGESLGELFAAILEDDPVPLHVRVPEVNAHLEAIVMRCLAKKPEMRFPSAESLAVALSPFAPPGRVSGLASRALSPSYPGAPQGGSGDFPRSDMIGRGLVPAPSSRSGPAVSSGPYEINARMTPLELSDPNVSEKSEFRVASSQSVSDDLHHGRKSPAHLVSSGPLSTSALGSAAAERNAGLSQGGRLEERPQRDSGSDSPSFGQTGMEWSGANAVLRSTMSGKTRKRRIVLVSIGTLLSISIAFTLAKWREEAGPGGPGVPPMPVPTVAPGGTMGDPLQSASSVARIPTPPNAPPSIIINEPQPSTSTTVSTNEPASSQSSGKVISRVPPKTLPQKPKPPNPPGNGKYDPFDGGRY